MYALLTIIPETVEKVYGDKEPRIPYTVEGLVNGETLETAVEVMTRLTACTTDTSAVGSYMIVYDNEPVSKNYGFLFRKAYVRVVPRQLLVSVEKSTRRYGEKNPDFTLTYDGFVNDEDTTALDWMPYVECDAYPWSPVGEYEVVVSGGHATNYTFVYTNGVLQVEKGLQEIIWEQELTELCVGDTVNLFAWATSDLPVTFETDTPDLCTIENGDYGSVLMCHAAGTVHVRAMQAGNENWEVAEPVDRELEISTSTGIAGHGVNRITVDADSRNIIVRGVAEGIPVRVYTLNGVRLYDELSRGEELRFAIDGSAVYIVHVGHDSFKVMAGRR